MRRNILGVLFLCMLVACSNNIRIKPNQLAEILVALNKGDLIKIGIENYKNNYGQYPEDLSQLVPEFLADVPATGIDNGWYGYFYFEKAQSYVLYFRTHAPSLVSLISPKELTTFSIGPSVDTSSTDYAHVHFIVEGWVYLTQGRYTAGDGVRGHVKDSDWSSVKEFCSAKNLECSFP